MSESVKKAAFRFTGFQITESAISRTPKATSGDVDVKIYPKGHVSKADNKFMLELEVKVRDETCFEIELVALGFFEFESDIEDSLENFFFLNAPAILFPHIRAYVGALTALSGMETILVPALNLSALAPELRENTRETDDSEE